jgi:DNA helicase-2/ATP-dependent DNA helicase PcrA
MDRVTFVSALLNQQVETWYPRCSSSNQLNGIESLHGFAGLTNELIDLYQRWENYLNDNQVLDFATIQKRFIGIQSKVQNYISHVFVDEFQDNNPIQFAIHTGWLAGTNIRLTVVGDDDQALYRFRGSDSDCFSELQPFCRKHNINYRQEKLEENYRSTRSIVDFSQAFRNSSVLCQVSMAKDVKSPINAEQGIPVRLLRGPWDAVCRCVANELLSHNCGQIPASDKEIPSTGAVLMFSTSERSDTSPSLRMREALESEGIRAYNPRNKTAADKGSPVYELIALISYLIDPVRKAPVGKGGRMVEVAASMNDRSKASVAITDMPRKDNGDTFRINEDHLKCQKGFIKSDGSIDNPGPATRDLLRYLDSLRDELAEATERYKAGQSEHKPRLTLAGLIARLLSFPRYRGSGFTEDLFRQALFTNLLEAHTAPTRRTQRPLDAPLQVERNASGKYVWSNRYWNFLNIFGSYLSNSSLDNPEIEAFEEDAVLLLTFHQSKGLEFDHVYVAGTGRNIDFSPVLRTQLFSGKTPSYTLDPTGVITTSDAAVQRLALSDREREVYVALTRAKKTLTLVHDTEHERLTLNPAIEELFRSKTSIQHPQFPDVEVLEYIP